MAKAAEAALLSAAREASAYFDRFDKTILYHAAAHLDRDWLLSDSENTSSFIPPPPGGLISGLPLNNEGRYTFLIEKQEGGKPLNLQELQQVTRELIEGIYVFNQLPSITLEANYDSTTSCSIPSAYNNTLIGQALLSLDYFTKSLLHGSTVRQKDKRSKLLEEWKKFPQENLRKEFEANGMTDMQNDNELGKSLYHKKKIPFVRYPPKYVNTELALRQLDSRLTTGEEYEQMKDHKGRDQFLQHLEHVSLGIVFRQENILYKDGIFVLDPAHDVVTNIMGTAPEKDIDPSLHNHLHSYLQKQREFVSDNLNKKRDIAHRIQLLSFVSFMIYFLVSLKKTNRVVDISNFLPLKSKDLMRTDRELPPILPTSSSRWSPYLSENNTTGMHGDVTFEKSKLTANPVEISPSEMERIKESLTHYAISGECSINDEELAPKLSISLLDKDLTTCVIGEKTYYAMELFVEPYYSKTPKLPRWLHAMTAEMKTQCARLLSLNDARIQDMLRKPLGIRKAAALKTVNVSLQASIEKGSLPAVTALLKRCTHTRLGKPDEKGMLMLHYAATYARPDVLSALILSDSNIEQPLENSQTRALHLVAQAGNVDAFYCLLRYGADLCTSDSNGWFAIHIAAFHNCQSIVRHFASINSEFLEMEAENKLKSTPLLISAESGGFDSFKCLIELGANVTATDSTGSNAVHLAALKHHTKVLRYLIETKGNEIDVWAILSEMLKSEGPLADAAARSLDPLTQWKPKESAESLLKLNTVESLVQLLKRNETSQLLAIQVLANLSHFEEIKSALMEKDAVSYLTKLLVSFNDRIHANTCLVLSDLAVVSENQEAVASSGALPHLTKLMSSESDDVQLFSSALVGILAYDNPNNQKLIAEANCIPVLVSLLSSTKSCIRGCASRALGVAVDGNRTNQLLALVENIIPCLIVLLRSKEPPVHKSAAVAVESLATNSEECQRELLSDSTCINLLKRLLKMRNPEVKVCGGCALWAIAGNLISNKRLIATHIGLELLVDMLTIHNEHLDFVCAEALGAIATELGDNQVKIIQVGGVKPLVDALTVVTSQRVCLSVIHTLSALCMKPALVPNAAAQRSIASSRGIPILCSIVSADQASEIVRVEAACTLAKLILNNPENDKILTKHTDFSFLTIFKFFTSSDSMVRLLAGHCLSIMAFNNPDNLRKMKAFGTLNVSNFLPFLQSGDEFYQIHAAFQIVVLSKLLVGMKDVDCTVKGIKLLVHLLSSYTEQTKVLSAEFIATLSRMGSGIPGALVLAGVLDPLLANFESGNRPVIESTSVALGYLTFNRMASRLVIGMFRDSPELFHVFEKYFPFIVYSQKFRTAWTDITRPGIPSLR